MQMVRQEVGLKRKHLILETVFMLLFSPFLAATVTTIFSLYA